ncbi:MAG: hypothetical protein ABIM88_02830 [candidate division WOR-3 bacterium]
MLVILIISQNQLQLSGSGGFRAVVPSEWSFYQEDNDRAVVSGPLWGFDGSFRSGMFGVGAEFLTGSFSSMEVHKHNTGDVEEVEADLDRMDFALEGKVYPSDFYLGLLFVYHSETWESQQWWGNLTFRHYGNSLGFSAGYQMPPRHMALSPKFWGAIGYFTGERRTIVNHPWGQTTDTDEGEGARFAGEIGLSYHYKPIYLNLGFMGQGLVARFGDDTVTSHSNLWGLYFGAGAYF